jgi:hypothetical protein
MRLKQKDTYSDMAASDRDKSLFTIACFNYILYLCLHKNGYYRTAV